MSIDVETTGLDPATSDLLSVGCVIFNSQNPEYKELYTREWFVYHTHLRGHPRAFVMNAELVSKADDTLSRLPIDIISHEILEMVQTYPRRVTFAGKNFLNFDELFLTKYLPDWAAIRKYSGRRVLDPGSMFAKPTDDVPPDLRNCCVRAGIVYEDSKAHDAIYDARLVAKCIHSFFYTRT